MAAQFNPTEQELVNLVNSVLGNPLPTDDVFKVDVYRESWWKNLFEFLEKNRLYFLTELKQKLSRVAVGGTWKGEQVAKPIYDADGKIIGSKRNFSFTPKDGSVSWVMHEYRLKGGNMNVLCRIRKRGSNGSTAAIDTEALSQMMNEFENVIGGGGGP